MTVSQKGAQKKKSVRNHIFVIDSIICDVLSSVKNPQIDISVMDYRKICDSEEKCDCCENSFWSHRKKRIISDKIMQGYVLGPLVSSNMVDKHFAMHCNALEKKQLQVEKFICIKIRSLCFPWLW